MLTTPCEVKSSGTQKAPDIFPDDLFADCPGESSSRQWWVLYTKPRNEKALARQLQAMGVPFYLPLVLKQVVYRNRRMTLQIPLFPGYLFLFGSDEERVRSLTTNRVSRNYSVCDQLALHRDLRQIRQLIAARTPLTVESRLAAGRSVRVRHGSLVGLEGTVISRLGQTRLLISVNFLQQGASVVI